jgi:hypothetical protein
MSKLDSEQLRTLQPPDGWEFVKRPTIKTVGSIRRTGPYTEAQIPDALSTLFKWAKEHRLGLKGDAQVAVRFANYYGNAYVWSSFQVKANVTLSRCNAQHAHPEATCGECSYRLVDSNTPPASLTCRRCGMALFCYNCRVYGFSPITVKTPTGRIIRYGCASCADVCDTPKCTNITVDGAKKCPTCEPVEMCSSCKNYFPQRDMEEVAAARRDEARRRELPAKYACKPCKTKHSCQECGAYSPRGLALDATKTKRLCALCLDKADDRERERLERWNDDELPIHGSLKITSLPERPTRLVSIETELDGDGRYLARTLYRCGLVEYPKVLGYREYADRRMSYPCFLKYDGSVTAGELITFLLDLDDPVHAKAFLEVLTKVRSLREMGRVSHGITAGGHIHIDAHNFTYSDAWRLVTIWNYLEDPIFRLAGAGAGKHRSLDPRSEAPRPGGYSKSVVKGPWGTRSAFGLSLEQQDRHCGLNFRPFLESRDHCVCGDLRYGDGKNCQCNLPKATIEWRVWNSISNPRILHGWLAFMQAVHAYAQQDKEMRRAEEDQFPAMPWPKKPFDTLSDAAIKKWKERIEWAHKHLPLTPEERDSIVYALKHTEVAERLGHQYLDGLLAIENNHGLLAKVGGVRNPSRRERKITIKAPAPGAVDEGGLALEDDPFDIAPRLRTRAAR